MPYYHERSALSRLGALVGIIAGLTTILRFVYPDAKSAIEGIVPPLRVLVDRWPLGPWPSAGVMLALVAGLRFLTLQLFEYEGDGEPPDMITDAILMLPLLALWIWIFHGAVSLAVIVSVSVAYAIVVSVMAVVAADW